MKLVFEYPLRIAISLVYLYMAKLLDQYQWAEVEAQKKVRCWVHYKINK